MQYIMGNCQKTDEVFLFIVIESYKPFYYHILKLYFCPSFFKPFNSNLLILYRLISKTKNTLEIFKL